jgi:hypothetical protein
MQRKLGTDWALSLRNKPLGEITRNVLNRVCRASFWEWKDGSALIFWRWPEPQQQAAWAGYPIWVRDELPCCRHRQWREANPDFKKKIEQKLQAMRGR